MASYNDLGLASSVSCVAFHPHDHIVAFCSLYEDSPVLIYKYDHQVAKKAAGLDVQLTSLDPTKREEL